MRRGILIVILILGMTSFAWGAEKKVVRVWHTETEAQTIAAFQSIIDEYEKRTRTSPSSRRGWLGAIWRPN
jgi:hypothetical protein